MQEPGQTIVVGAAIVRHGLLLAARRTAPSALAGGWELPGGKVEPGETEQEALVRECREELGITVLPSRRYGPELRTASGYLLRTWLCDLPDGEPQVREEHDALRWLGPEHLHDVAWLAADLALLPVLRDVLLDGDPLAGGLIAPPVRIGSTVRRACGPWTPAVHDLLTHLRGAGVPHVPAAHGLDSRGREVLDFLPGTTAQTALDGSTRHLAGLLEALGAWTRQMHAASIRFAPGTVRRWRSGEAVLRAGQVICHNDLSPANVLVEGSRLVGVIDWDMAAPGHRLDDLAYSAWQFVLRRNPGAPAEADGLAALCGGYGADPLVVLDRVVPRMRGALRRIEQGAARGDEGMTRVLAAGVLGATQAGLAALQRRRARIDEALAGRR